MHMSERYDLAIIGSSPAGLSVVLNAKIRNLFKLTYLYNETMDNSEMCPRGLFIFS